MISEKKVFDLFSDIDMSCTAELQRLGIEGTSKLTKGGILISFESFDPGTLSKVARLPVKGFDFSKVKMPEIRDLKRFSLSEIWIPSDAEIRFSDLNDFKLESLFADGVQFTDFESLACHPLQHLSLGKTKLLDLDFLETNKLQTLNVSFTDLSDVSFLINQPKLEKLNLFKCKISDISSASCRSISHLNLSGNPISDLTGLEENPLRHLELRATKVSSLRPLSYCPLKSLNLPGSQVEFLGDVSTCPIQELNIIGLAIKDLQCIEQMPLRSLMISPDKITKSDFDLLQNITIENLIGPGDPKSQTKEEFFQKYSSFI